MKPTLLVLDQWASQDYQAGTSKNWLYKGFAEIFDTRVINADTPFLKRLVGASCLFQALLSHPADLRCEYYRQLEWEAKKPASFRARSSRFQRAINRLSEHDATFQVGSLFGPIISRGKSSFSYHDQTVAMVEQMWPEWLPRNFPRFREQFFELERASLQAKDLVFTYSERTRKSMLDDYALPAHKVIVAPTACKIPYPAANQVLTERVPKLIFAATDFFRKGGDLVLKAFKELRLQRQELELILVGVKAPEPLPDGARHLGMVPFDKLMAEYLSASLILHPARHDAYPNVLKEALACGLPAVTSDSCGIPEIVANGETGMVLKRNDVPSIVETVSDLLDDPERLQGMRERCLVERERFRPKNCVARITEAMCDVMTEKGSQHR
ncbi:glycosyltransferase family 4 protein [Desulfonatronum thiodismutans]|uniref:glycosyltransferase family 4 protein n=1 Tax=Desulfonatronum thiodismutans TaxID=159290 RepID=UPI0004ABD974|nr:glycosyltransferase family 4 protein [Desulfonatronum thiodismutans]